MTPFGANTLFLCLAGSHAHGTSRPGSDVDLRGVCVAPVSVRLSLFGGFEQYEGPLDPALSARGAEVLRTHAATAGASPSKTECVVFDVAKFLSLCAGANPNALEILFADERDWLVETPAWRKIYDERRRFLTRRVQQTFLGYGLAQLKRIKTHRAWLLDPPKRRPTREDFGLPASGGVLSADDVNRLEQSIAEKVRGFGVDDLEMPKHTRIAVEERLTRFSRDAVAASGDDLPDRLRAVATASLGIPVGLVTALNAEKRFRSAMKHWDAYETWQRERNPVRAELERQHGYDTKHAMHLIRLMRMGLEVLERGELLVRRPDAAELIAIRDGALSFDDLLASAARLEEQMRSAALDCHLPEDLDRQRVDELAIEIMLSARA